MQEDRWTAQGQIWQRYNKALVPKCQKCVPPGTTVPSPVVKWYQRERIDLLCDLLTLIH